MTKETSWKKDLVLTIFVLGMFALAAYLIVNIDENRSNYLSSLTHEERQELADQKVEQEEARDKGWNDSWKGVFDMFSFSVPMPLVPLLFILIVIWFRPHGGWDL